MPPLSPRRLARQFVVYTRLGVAPLLRRIAAVFAGADGDRLAFGVPYLLLLPLYLGPLAVTRLLPGLDLPFHLSMVDMLEKGDQPGTPYAPYYQGVLGVAPYAAHYLAVWGLGKIFPLMVAHKIVVAIYVASLPLTAAALLATCGRSRVPALLAFPLAYNLTLHYGFVSFALSLPVLLWWLGQLARFLLEPRCEVRRWLLTAAAAVLLFLCHLQNFLYGVCAALAFVALSDVSWRRRLLGLAGFLPALAAFLWWQIGSGARGPFRQSFVYAFQSVLWARVGDVNRRHGWAHDIGERLVNIPEHVLRGFADRIDVQACRTLLAVLAVYVVLGLVGGRERLPLPAGVSPSIGEARLRGGCWVAFGGALFAYLALPHHLPAFELTTFFPRFAVLVVLVALLVVPAGLARFSGLLRAALPVPAVLFCLLYGSELTARYRLYAEEVGDFLHVVEKVPPGARAVGLVFDRSSRVMRIESALLGLPNLYPILRSAPGSMIPLSYCGMRHIPCRPGKRLDVVPVDHPWSPQHLVPEKAVPFFEYFLVRSPKFRPDFFGAEKKRVALVANRGSWQVYHRFR